MHSKLSGLIIMGASLAGAAGLALADSTYYPAQAEPRNGYVYDNYAGYAPGEDSWPVTSDEIGVETVNRGAEPETAWLSNDSTWTHGTSDPTSAPDIQVNVGDPDVAQVLGRG